jgi:hypothetical protein
MMNDKPRPQASGTHELELYFAQSKLTSVQIAEVTITARCIPLDFDEAEKITNRFLLEVVRQGGRLATVEEPAEWEVIPDRASETVGYRHKVGSYPEFFLYHFFNCSFEQSVDMIPLLCKGASREIRALPPLDSSNVKVVAVQKYLIELSTRQEIGIFEYLSSSIAVCRLGRPTSDWREEVRRAMDFDERFLGADYSTQERTDYIEQFARHGFFRFIFR